MRQRNNDRCNTRPDAKDVRSTDSTADRGRSKRTWSAATKTRAKKRTQPKLSGLPSWSLEGPNAAKARTMAGDAEQLASISLDDSVPSAGAASPRTSPAPDLLPDYDDLPLSVLFARGQAAFRDLDSGVKQARKKSGHHLRLPRQQSQSLTHDTIRQASVEKGVEALTSAWQAVRRGALFSPNESKDDLSTSHLKYVLVPYYLGEVCSCEKK